MAPLSFLACVLLRREKWWRETVGGLHCGLYYYLKAKPSYQYTAGWIGEYTFILYHGILYNRENSLRQERDANQFMAGGTHFFLTGRADYKNPLANETELQQLNRKVELFIG